MGEIEVSERGDRRIVSGQLGVPNEGIFNIASGEGDITGLTIEGQPAFAIGDEIDITGVGNITAKGTHLIVVTAAGKVR